MAFRKALQRPQDPTAAVGTKNTLPIDEDIALYYRQSTVAQYGNISTEMQLLDLPDYVMRLGWPKNKIIIIDEDYGVSGNKKISERVGMQRLYDLIVSGRIRAVACIDEDRLFRDLSQIQVNIFIEACMEANVRVITPSTIYDFRGPDGIFYARQFRFRSEMAADFIRLHIRGRLHAAKNYMHRQGHWVGGRVPLGYLVDMRKLLPDGTKNPQWRKYAPFPPYAEIVSAYFQILIDCNFVLSVALRQIMRHGPFFPNQSAPQTLTQVPPGYMFYPSPITKIEGDRYHPTYNSLRRIATNVVYIGHWVWNNQIVRWDNHPAIVPGDLFMTVFNHFCETDLEGNPNPQYLPPVKLVFPGSNSHLEKSQPLFEHNMISYCQDTKCRVSAAWVKRIQGYRYVVRGGIRDEWHRGKSVKAIDSILSSLLLLKIEITIDMGDWKKLNRRDPFFGDAAKKQAATNQIDRLEALLEATNPKDSQLSLDSRMKRVFNSILERWEKLGTSKQKQIIDYLIREIELIPVIGKPTDVRVCWQDGQSDLLRIPNHVGELTSWLDSDLESLVALIKSEKSQLEIAAEFPFCSWQNIRRVLYLLDIPYSPRPMKIKASETYFDYLQRVKGNNPKNNPPQNRWSAQETQRLKELLEAGAQPMDIAVVFPYRAWGVLQTKIRKLRGRGLSINNSYRVFPNETAIMYFERMKLPFSPSLSAEAIVKSPTALPHHSRLYEKPVPLDLVRLITRAD